MLNNFIIKNFDSLYNYSLSLWFSHFNKNNDKEKDTFLTAFVHKSYASDFVPPLSHNERLEFLWDSILWACVWSLLYINYPNRSEAQMTLYKIALVREENLAKIARNINLWEYIMLSNGEEKQWGKDKDAILADTLEALLWAQYIINGFKDVQVFIEKHIRPELSTLMETDCKSYKSLIQERAQWCGLPIPGYETVEKKENKETLFYSRIFVWNDLLWEWFGENKKRAQEAAAEEAYKKKKKV